MEIAQEKPGPAPRTSGLYEWSAWADGQERVAVKGVDFTCAGASFAQAAKSWGERNGYDTEVVRRGDRVWFAFRGDPAARPAPEERLTVFLDPYAGYLIPEAGGFASRHAVMQAYAYYRSQTDAPPTPIRDVHAAVRTLYRPARRAGVVGYAGVRT